MNTTRVVRESGERTQENQGEMNTRAEGEITTRAEVGWGRTRGDDPGEPGGDTHESRGGVGTNQGERTRRTRGR